MKALVLVPPAGEPAAWITEEVKTGGREDIRSPLALQVGSKGYHPYTFTEGPYPTV